MSKTAAEAETKAGDDNAPILVWIRRDLRLSDHGALSAAAATGRPVIPVFIHDQVIEALGAAPKFRFGLGVEAFGQALSEIGSRLILRRGKALAVLKKLIEETGARSIYWQRAYDPAAKERDTEVKSALKEAGLEARSLPGQLLFEPWSVETKTGGFYKVYTPFWRAVKDTGVSEPLDAIGKLASPDTWPESDALADWAMGDAMGRGASVVANYVNVGEAAARDRLDHFIDTRVAAYQERRDFPAEAATSRLSEAFTYGEMSPRSAWFAGLRAMESGADGAEHFLKELVWREFAYHLLHHTPHLIDASWRDGWDRFPWNDDPAKPEVQAWQRGRTGVAFVDAAMREMYVTGTMHNRARMIAGSYLTKHLLGHWKIGLDWFADCLIDWDPASNAMGWQWVAGSGPDAAPYFRIFNPDGQADKFDKSSAYRDRWIAEGRAEPSDTALSYFDAVPKSWGLSPSDAYPGPVVALDEGRKRALAAYEDRDF
ncbi:MAG: deoxyribodipyrimidine photo-lyase [Pseudomonadota bacterium]